MLKRLAVTARISAKQEQSTNAALVDNVAESEEQWELDAERSVMVLASCIPQRAAVLPNKGGRGIERLRLFGLPNPAGRPAFQGTSCYINLWPSARHGWPAPASPIPFHFRRLQPARRHFLRCERAASLCASSSAIVEVRVTQQAPRQPQPSLADRVRVEVLTLSLAPGWATPPWLVAEVRCAGSKSRRV